MPRLFAFPPIAPLTSLLVAAAALPAQQSFVLAPRTDSPRTESVQVDVDAFDASGRIGGQGFVAVHLVNRDTEPHTVRLELRDQATLGRALRVTDEITVLPGLSGDAQLPFPRTGVLTELVATLDSGARGTAFGVTGRARSDFGLLLIGASTAAWSDAAGRAHDIAATSANTARPVTGVLRLDPDELPAEWTSLSGLDLVVIDAAHPQLDDRAASTLLAFVRAGGRLAIDNAERATPAALGSVVAAAPAGRIALSRLGVGQVLVRRASGELSITDLGLVADLLGPSPTPNSGLPALAGPLPLEAFELHTIRGIAPISASTFLAIVLAFVVLVGPVNHFALRGRDRAWLVLFTVPAAGALVTAGILLTTVLSEGTSIRGVRATLTVLDQAARRATSVARATVFAPTSPERLRPRPGTYVATGALVAGRVRRPDEAATFVWQRADDGALSGALVPSREPTALATIVDEPCRARLRFRPLPGGELELLGDDQLEPTAAPGALVVTLADGRSFVRSGPGPLVPCSAREARERALELLGVAGADRPALAQRVADLRPGSYIAVVSAPPIADDLGLQVDWQDDRHVVVGHLGAEDEVR
ncbi:MAG: hypothetical protein IPM29_24915 [Planctomycetes bacterium]|nr:hypothetical protein [Planctomycetota bacterium]